VTPKAISEIKQGLEGIVGKRIRVRANKGRRQVVERQGVLETMYPSIFTVRLEEERHRGRRVSFSYADLLTETVELIVVGKEAKAEASG